jgi:hypothetical protein
MSNDIDPAVDPVTDPAAVVQTETVENADKPTDPAPVKSDAETAEEAKQRAIQKRFDKLTREKYEAKAKADFLEEIIRQQQQPQTGRQQDGKPTKAKFANDEDFVEALTDWKLAQRDHQFRDQEAQRTQQTVAQKRDALLAAAEENDGFDRDEFARKVPVTEVMASAILDSDIGAKLVIHLNANPDEAKRIALLPPARQAAELGKLEAKLLTAPAPKSNAPKPISPVGNSPVSSKDPSQMSDAEFANWRRQQIKNRS